VGQKAWQIVLSGDPGFGAWKKTEKHARWCQETMAQMKSDVDQVQKRHEIVEQFREALTEICTWKQEAKHRFKMGLSQMPAPASYGQFDKLKHMRNQLLTPSK